MGEIGMDKVIPQLAGRALANADLILAFLAAFLMQLQAACLSAVVVAEEARFDAPAQHAAGGIPLPLFR